MRILIKNGTVINPLGEKGDISIKDGVVERIGEASGEYDRVIDAKGKLVTPGLIDMHVHLRDPGFEYKEDIVSGTAAAAKGGFTGVACMPNTSPVIDNEPVVSYIINKAKTQGSCKVYPIASITKAEEGEELSEMGLLKAAGAVAFSDDGRPVTSSRMMRMALEYGSGFDALMISHCEDKELAGDGVMNEGFNSTAFGLKGISRAAEEVMAARDIILCETFGGRLHLAHISTKGTAELVRQAKARGVNVTCETCPHYFAADDSMVGTYDTNTKVNPPLRTLEDGEAIKAALKDGTIDCIVTDHAPHHADEKNVEYDIAMNGISGIETSLPLSLGLVRDGVLTLDELIIKMSANPARILGVEGGVIAEGKPADITIIDPDAKYVFKKEDIISKGKNSPFIGREMQGRVVMTLLDGEVSYEYEG